ncbi:MAG: hypothetical protein CO090_03340 [Acidobacteria bacterium CG_4_9_14_3_um_filter_49_7]|nr:MAG: hypothetical protein CO090_03340 [Acidobacteria bacterium CG_4_9_14_3_um_filter_49_7]
MNTISPRRKILLILVALLAAGVSPNLFVAAQAGHSTLHHLALVILLPSLFVLAVVYGLARLWGFTDVHHQMSNGIIAGLVATLGLELVRQIGFHMGGMPGDMPKLLGVLLFNRFAQGPSLLSNIAGYAYHFWNGAAFGVIFSLIFGRGRVWLGTFFGVLIGIGFMVSPVAIALGVGYFGIDFGWGFAATVTLAHIAYGLLLGLVIHRLNTGAFSLLSRITELF